MNEILEKSLLFDFYGELLSDHQKEVYSDVVFNDYSLSEVADSYGISRQGVYDLIKRCNNALKGYEDKLKLVEKFIDASDKAKHIIENVNSIEKSSLGESLSGEDKKKLDDIKKLASEIMEDL